MLSGTDRKPDEIVGIRQPNIKECTVKIIFINAVMAGARQEYIGAILALVEAASKLEFALYLHTTRQQLLERYKWFEGLLAVAIWCLF